MTPGCNELLLIRVPRRSSDNCKENKTLGQLGMAVRQRIAVVAIDELSLVAPAVVPGIANQHIDGSIHGANGVS